MFNGGITIEELNNAGLLPVDVSKDFAEESTFETSFYDLSQKLGGKRTTGDMTSYKMFAELGTKKLYAIKTVSSQIELILDDAQTSGTPAGAENIQVDDFMQLIQSATGDLTEQRQIKSIVNVTVAGSVYSKITLDSAFTGNVSVGDTIYLASTRAGLASKAKAMQQQLPVGFTNSCSLLRKTIGSLLLSAETKQYVNVDETNKMRIRRLFKEFMQDVQLNSTGRVGLQGSEGSAISDSIGLFYSMRKGLIQSNLRDPLLGVAQGVQYYNIGNAVTTTTMNTLSIKNQLGSRKKYLFCDKVLAGSFGQWLINKTVPTTYDETLSIKFKSFDLNGTEFVIVPFPMFDKMAYVDGGGVMHGYYMIVDFAAYANVAFTKFNAIIAAKVNRADNPLTTEEELITILGPSFWNAENFGWGTHTITL